MDSREEPRDWLSVAVLALAALSFALGVLALRTHDGQNLIAYDFYGQFYPYIVHAWRSLGAGGGLLWNPYQDCGQPFFGNSQTGLLYPVNVVFAVLPREPALLASVIINLTIAGVGMFQLCRTLRIERVPALCGALAFQLGWAASMLAAWSPTHIAPFAWLPVAMWRLERLIRAPSLRGGVWLALVLAIQLLPGFPQTVFFTYQLIALRAVWALLFRQVERPRIFLVALALGLVGPVLLDAVQLLPAMEVARESVRQSPVSDARLGASFSWRTLRQTLIAQTAEPGNALLLLVAMVGVAAAPRLRRATDAAFYALVAILYFVLSLGPGSIVYAVYARLPMGSAFRGPARLLWVTNFAVAVLVALGCQALLNTDRAPRTRARLGAALLAGTAALYVLSAGALRLLDLGFIALLVAWALAPSRPSVMRAAPFVLIALIACDVLIGGRAPVLGLRRGDVYGRNAEVFDFVRARLTPQDRVLIVGGQPALDLMAKSATLFALPNIHDYDALAAQRYAEYFTFLRTARTMHDFEDWYWIFDKLLPSTLQRPLFDATAARYLIVAQRLDTTSRAFDDSLHLLLERDGVRVYENDQAMPRARYVGRVTGRDDAQVLPALIDRAVDLRREVVVSAADAARLSGSGGDGSGSVEFVADEPERVVLRVRATAPGFLFLADEYFPGWTATVNGQAQDIVPANHSFRLVAVPAGESEVVFTYRPLSLRIGAVVSAIAVIGFVILWRRGDAARPAAIQIKPGIG